MILAVDCGNSRVKWGMHDGRSWAKTGTLPLSRIAGLRRALGQIQRTDAIVVANVAGPAARERIEDIVVGRGKVIWVKAKRRECGVANRYTRPAQLGADRWAALIAARSMVRGACLVVGAGTATTIDALRRDGTFAGGMILPGLDLMKRSLAQSTAGLPLARGRFSRAPKSTADAIESGCLSAQAGAIERAFSAMGPGAVCLLSGGAAARIAACLAIPARLVDNLVLEGLVRIARASE